MKLIVYGDFNCPYSRLASDRVNRLVERGLVEVEWRAVQHDQDIPPGGLAVEGELKKELEGEVEEINGLLRSGESVELKLPDVRPNTEGASRIYATQEAPDRDAWRTRAFDAVWANAGNLDALTEPGPDDPETAAAWQREWMDFEKRMVPLLVLPDGYVSRGLGALKRLADLLDG